jgi:hypothetical protein
MVRAAVLMQQRLKSLFPLRKVICFLGRICCATRYGTDMAGAGVDHLRIPRQ